MTVSTHKTFTFDTEKWIENRGIQRCSRITKSVILDMMIYSVKHNGTFRIDDKSAIRIGATNEELQHALSEIQQFNVTTIEDGMITFDCISSCLQKKEKVSEKRREAAEKRWGKQEENLFDANACDEKQEPTCPFMQQSEDKKSFVCKCITPWSNTKIANLVIPRSYLTTAPFSRYTIDNNNIYNNIYNFRRGSVREEPFANTQTVEKQKKTSDSTIHPSDIELLKRCNLPDKWLESAGIDPNVLRATTDTSVSIQSSQNGDFWLFDGVSSSDVTRTMDALKKRLKKPELNDSEKKFCKFWCMYPTDRRRGGSMEKHYDLWKKNCKGDEDKVLAYAEEYLYPFNEDLKESVFCMHSIRFLRTMDWENYEMENEE